VLPKPFSWISEVEREKEQDRRRIAKQVEIRKMGG